MQIIFQNKITQLFVFSVSLELFRCQPILVHLSSSHQQELLFSKSFKNISISLFNRNRIYVCGNENIPYLDTNDDSILVNINILMA